MQNESKPMTTEELIQEGAILQKKLEETIKQLRDEKGSKTFWKFLVMAIVCICLYYKKSNMVWLPVADSQRMCVVMSDWWGLKAGVVYPVWRAPDGATEAYPEQWCVKYPDDSWRVFYGGDRKSSAYTFPSTIYGTSF